MKKRFLILLFTQCIMSVGFTQNYEKFEFDKIEVNSNKSIVFQHFKTDYDLIISKHNLSRNDKNEVFEIIAFT